MSSTVRLLSKVLGDVSDFIEAKRLGVTEAAFYTAEEKLVWGIIESHFRRHTNIPDYDTILKLAPTFTLMDTGKLKISELVEKIHKERVEIEIRTHMTRIEDLLSAEQYDEAIGLMHHGATAASQGWGLSSDVSMTSNAEDLLYAYEAAKEGGVMRGIPWPWQPLNDATGGIVQGTYNVLYGRMKSTKTFRLLEIAVSARNAGKKVLICSCEMNDQVMLKRIAAIECELDYDLLTRGILESADEKRFQQYIIDQMANSSGTGEIIVTQLTDNADGRSVSALRSKIDEHQPDIVLVDSLYKMLDEQTNKRDGSPQTIRNISYDLQQLSQISRIPFVVTTQANRKGQKARLGDTSDVAFSDAFAMDCDLLLRMVNDVELGRTVFLVQAARETILEGFSVGNVMCSGMGPILRSSDNVEDWAIPAKYRGEGEDSPPDKDSGPGGGGASGRFQS